MTGVAVFLGTPSAPWHVLQTSNLAPRMAAASAAFPGVGTAAAQIAGKSQPDLGLARLLDAVEQRFGQHDHAGDAVAALRRLLGDESGLQRVRVLGGAEAFERGDLRLPEHADWRDAGAH